MAFRAKRALNEKKECAELQERFEGRFEGVWRKIVGHHHERDEVEERGRDGDKTGEWKGSASETI